MIYDDREFIVGQEIEVVNRHLYYLSIGEIVEIGTIGVIYDIIIDDLSELPIIQIYWFNYDLHRESPALAPWTLLLSELDRINIRGMTTLEQRKRHWSRLIQDLVIYET